MFKPRPCDWSISPVERYTGKERACSNQNSTHTRYAEPHLELSFAELWPPGHHVCSTLREEHQEICVAFKENPGRRTKKSHGSHVPQTSPPCPASREVITFMLNAEGEACLPELRIQTQLYRARAANQGNGKHLPHSLGMPLPTTSALYPSELHLIHCPQHAGSCIDKGSSLHLQGWIKRGPGASLRYPGSWEHQPGVMAWNPGCSTLWEKP